MTTADPIVRNPNEQQSHVDLAVVDRVRSFCMSLPGTTEKEAWGDPTFRVATRVYTAVKFGHDQANLWMAAPEGAQEMLLASDPDRFYYPPYEGSRGWIAMRLDTPPGIDWQEAEFLLGQAHEVIRSKTAPKRAPRAAQ